MVQEWAVGAVVVKALNTTGFENMADPNYGGTPTTMFIAGDGETAKATVFGLARDIGFEPIDAGPLARARVL